MEDKAFLYNALKEVGLQTPLQWIIGPEPPAFTFKDPMEPVLVEDLLEEFINNRESFIEKCSVSKARIQWLAENTADLRNSQLWGKYRKPRLKGSKFGESARYWASFAVQFFCAMSFETVWAMLCAGRPPPSSFLALGSFLVHLHRCTGGATDFDNDSGEDTESGDEEEILEESLVFQQNLLPETHVAIDEQVVPFKCHHNLKRYLPKKLGYKLWAHAGISGYVYDFEVEGGVGSKGAPKDCEPPTECGESDYVVLCLTTGLSHTRCFLIIILPHQPAELFCLLKYLKQERKIWAVATLNTKHARKCPLPTEKEMKKIGRGFAEEFVDETESVVLERARKRNVGESSGLVGERRSKKQRKTISKDVCFLRDEEEKEGALRKASTMKLNDRLNQCSRILNDGKLLALLSAGDAVAQDLMYHPKCLASLYNRVRSHLASQNDHLNHDEDSENQNLAVAFSELFTYIIESCNSGEGPHTFRLADLVLPYKQRVKQQIGMDKSSVNSTRLKEQLLLHLPELEAYYKGRDVLLAFHGDIATFMEQANKTFDAVHTLQNPLPYYAKICYGTNGTLKIRLGVNQLKNLFLVLF
eukprot:gene9826-18399_t